ncbi:reverse transcriptase [Gossypium australe]|uniref:Reverse transcriptase n=1 Tax=Gossypium australe TaxID=47621 RepID=A0A5B6VNZ6_9ROSI|nr:reverse transcriptase [Gossypium australe]
MINVPSGMTLVNMTPQRVRELISATATNFQLFQPTTKPTRRGHELCTSSLEDKIDKLTNLCGICAMPDHPPDSCPILHDDTIARVDAIGNFPGPPQRRYDPYSNTYN